MTKKRPLSAPDSSQPEETPGPHSERLEGSGTHAIPLGLRESLDHSPDLVFVAGPDGRVIWANRAYDQLTGLDRTELVGEPFPSLVSGPSRRIAQHYIAGMWGFWRVFDTRQPDLAVIPNRAANQHFIARPNRRGRKGDARN